MIGALVMAVVAGCGSSARPVRNGLILAARNGVLYVMNGDGSGLRKVASESVGSAEWTPDGKSLAFNTYHPIVTADVSWFRQDLWLMRLDGSGRHRVARNVPLGTFSPDAKTMAFMNDSCAPKFTADLRDRR